MSREERRPVEGGVPHRRLYLQPSQPGQWAWPWQQSASAEADVVLPTAAMAKTATIARAIRSARMEITSLPVTSLNTPVRTEEKQSLVDAVTWSRCIKKMT